MLLEEICVRVCVCNMQIGFNRMKGGLVQTKILQRTELL